MRASQEKAGVSPLRLCSALLRCWSGYAWLALVGLVAGCGNGEQAAPGPVYTGQPPIIERTTHYSLAIHPLHNPRKLLEVYGPLADYLSRRIPGVHFEIEASKNYAHFETKLKRREVDFALPNPYQAYNALGTGYRVLAEAGNSDDFKGLVIVRRDAGISRPADLKGKVVAYPAKTALAAAMLPQYWLATQGLNVAMDMDNRYVGSQESAILNAYHRHAVAGVTWPPPWRAFRKAHAQEASELMAIWETPHLINNAIMVRVGVPEPLAAKVRELLLDMHGNSEGAAILKEMETERFNPADDARYRRVVGNFLHNYMAAVGPLP